MKVSPTYFRIFLTLVEVVKLQVFTKGKDSAHAWSSSPFDVTELASAFFPFRPGNCLFCYT